MIIGLHTQPNNIGIKLVAKDSLEEVYKTMIQELRHEGGLDGELTIITFSNGLRVVVKREVSWEEDDSNNLVEEESTTSKYDEFSEFDNEFFSNDDMLNDVVDSPEIVFREISREKISSEELLSIFTKKTYYYEE